MALRHLRVSGFTLLEMVVAIGIFAVISSIVYPAVQRFIDARERLNDKGGQLTSLQNTMLFLENDLRYVLDRQVRNGYGESEPAFSTDIESDEIFRLTAAYPDVGVYGSSVPKRVAWIFDDGELLRRTWGVLDRVSDTQESTRLMLKDVTDIDIRFASVDGNDLDWSSDWDGEQSLPRAIEISFELEDSITFRRVIELPGGVPAGGLDDS